MRGGAAHVQIADRRAVLRPSRGGPEKEELFERQLTLKDVAFRESKLPLDVERRQHLAMKNDVADVRRVLGNRVDHRIAERLTLVVPGCRWVQVIRRVLD